VDEAGRRQEVGRKWMRGIVEGRGRGIVEGSVCATERECVRERERET